MDKPQSKWQAFAHVWDRGIVAVSGVILSGTAMVTNNVGIFLVLIWSLIFLVFGLWLVNHRR